MPAQLQMSSQLTLDASVIHFPEEPGVLQTVPEESGFSSSSPHLFNHSKCPSGPASSRQCGGNKPGTIWIPGKIDQANQEFDISTILDPSSLGVDGIIKGIFIVDTRKCMPVILGFGDVMLIHRTNVQSSFLILEV